MSAWRSTGSMFTRPVLTAVLLAAVATTQAGGQTASALRGRVIDAGSGTPVPQARVTLFMGSDSLQATTDSAGLWRLSPGNGAMARLNGSTTTAARLVVRRLGFAPYARTLAPGMNTADRVEIALTPVVLSLDATVITAARREQQLADAVVPTELVSQQEIARTGASDVGTVLTQQTGVQVEGGTPAGIGVQLQGLGAQRVLILLDGQPLVGRLNGNFDLSRLPVGSIERIEIVKGPQSTLYGSDAMGGVINLVSRHPVAGQRNATINLTGGSLGRGDAHVSASSGGERLAAGIDAGARTQSLTPGIAGNTDTYARRADVAPMLTWRADSTFTLSASGLYVGERQRYRSGQLYRFSDNDQMAARLGGTWQRNGQRLGALAYVSRYDHLARASTLDAPQGAFGERDRQLLHELEVTYSGRSPAGIIDAGIDGRREGIVADRVLDRRHTIYSAEPYAQVTSTFGPVAITPGARFTWNERWGTFVSPRIAALWTPRPRLNVRATFGRGFRAPDFKELYFDFVNAAAGYAVKGNPELRPETSTSGQLNVEWSSDRVYARVGAFDNHLENFIENTDPTAGGVYTYANVARGRTTGVESEAGFTINRFRAEAGVATLDARDVRTGRVLLGRPRESARFTLCAARLLGVHATGTLLYTGRTPLDRDADGNVTVSRADFTRLDLNASRTILNTLKATVGVTNAFNRQLGDNWPGYTGRQLYATMSWQLNPQ